MIEGFGSQGSVCIEGSVPSVPRVHVSVPRVPFVSMVPLFSCSVVYVMFEHAEALRESADYFGIILGSFWDNFGSISEISKKKQFQLFSLIFNLIILVN